jgi:hypothetical protein
MDQATELVKQGISLFHGGDRGQAASSFHQATRANPRNQAAWLWLAQCVDSDEDKRQCLEQAHRIDPKSKAGQRAQAELDRLPPELELPPLPPAPPASPDYAQPNAGTVAPTVQPQTAQSSVLQRLVGIITFKSVLYREIAHDTSATVQAFLVQTTTIFILILLSLGMMVITASADMPIGLPWLIVLIPLVIIINVIIAILGSAILALITRLFKGTAKTDTIYRIAAYTQIFTLINVVPCIGVLIGSVLQFIGMVIGIREGARISTGKAVLTLLLPSIILTVIMILLLVAHMFMTMSPRYRWLLSPLTITVPTE